VASDEFLEESQRKPGGMQTTTTTTTGATQKAIVGKRGAWHADRGGGRRTGLWNDPITCQSTKNKPHEEASPKLSAGSGAGVRGYTDEVKKVESSFGKYRFGVTIAYNINIYRKSLRVSKSMQCKMKVATWIESIGSETIEYIVAYS